MTAIFQPSKPLRVGLIGAGMIGQLRARAVLQLPTLRLTAVADQVSERARRIAALAGNVQVYTDCVAMLEDDRIDAIILSTPPSSHEPLGLACLASGKHLLCEKPLAISVAGCEAMIRAAEQKGVCLATGFNLRYTRAAMLARELFDNGDIGSLDHIRAFHGHAGGKEFAHDWVRDRSSTGGGTLMDNGIHMIDLVRWFLGEVSEVKGHATHHTLRIPGCEDNGFLLMKNPAGNVATLQSSWTEWRGYGYRLELYGTEGFLRVAYPPLSLIHGRRSRNGRMKINRHYFPLYQLMERIKGWQWGLVETLARDLDGWANAILSGQPAPITGRDGLEAVRIAQSAVSTD